MNREALQEVAVRAAAQRGCTLGELLFDDDENVFELVLDKADAPVDLEDCEFVHRAVLAAFDRDVEDYALTVGSRGIGAEEADAMLKSL